MVLPPAPPVCGLFEPKCGHGRETGPEDVLDDLVQLDAGVHVRDRPLAVEQASHTHLGSGGAELLPPRHCPLAEPEEPACPGVAGDVVGGYRGPGEDEPSGLRGRIDGASHQVPELGRELPCIKEPWSASLQDRPRRDLHGTLDVSIIEEHIGAGCVQGGHGLAAGPGALDDHRTRDAQRTEQRCVDHSRPVRVPEHRSSVHDVGHSPMPMVAGILCRAMLHR